MMKLKSMLILGSVLLGGLGMTSIDGNAQSKVLFNKAPKVLRGFWEAKYRLHVASYPAIYSGATDLNVSDEEFHLEDFTYDKRGNSLFNSGPYGSFARKNNKLAFRKISKHHYVITGDYQAYSGKHKSGYRVLLSKNYHSMKVYRYEKLKRPGFVKGHRYYEGKFHLYKRS